MVWTQLYSRVRKEKRGVRSDAAPTSDWPGLFSGPRPPRAIRFRLSGRDVLAGQEGGRTVQVPARQLDWRRSPRSASFVLAVIQGPPGATDFREWAGCRLRGSDVSHTSARSGGSNRADRSNERDERRQRPSTSRTGRERRRRDASIQPRDLHNCPRTTWTSPLSPWASSTSTQCRSTEHERSLSLV